MLGLGASVWTADRYKGARIARELRVGMVWMNDHLVARSAPQIPWGGVGGAGIGRARGAIACAPAPSRASSPGTRPSGGRCGGSPTTSALVGAARAVAGLRERARRATASVRVAARRLRAAARDRPLAAGECAAVVGLADDAAPASSAACRTAWDDRAEQRAADAAEPAGAHHEEVVAAFAQSARG